MLLLRRDYVSRRHRLFLRKHKIEKKWKRNTPAHVSRAFVQIIWVRNYRRLYTVGNSIFYLWISYNIYYLWMILDKIIRTYIGVIFNWCQGPPVRHPAKTRGKLGLFSLMYRTLRPLYIIYICVFKN